MLDQSADRSPSNVSARRYSQPIISVRDLSLCYGEKQALKEVSFDLYPTEILAFAGPSGCGESTGKTFMAPISTRQRIVAGLAGSRKSPTRSRRRSGITCHMARVSTG